MNHENTSEHRLFRTTDSKPLVRGLTVVGGKAVDDVQVFPQRLHVLPGSQHGSDLCSPIADVRDVVLAQKEVMRRHLTGDLDALLLGSTDDHNLRGRDEK